MFKINLPILGQMVCFRSFPRALGRWTRRLCYQIGYVGICQLKRQPICPKMGKFILILGHSVLIQSIECYIQFRIVGLLATI